jgi:glycosyltransferase involved in cell wall biosynthesis
VPSLADSCPNTVMESIYNEIPVIGSKSGGIPEILIDSNSLFNPSEYDLQLKIISLFDYDNLNKILLSQKKIKEELTFDWVMKISEILGKN